MSIDYKILPNKAGPRIFRGTSLHQNRDAFMNLPCDINHIGPARIYAMTHIEINGRVNCVTGLTI